MDQLCMKARSLEQKKFSTLYAEQIEKDNEMLKPKIVETEVMDGTEADLFTSPDKDSNP